MNQVHELLALLGQSIGDNPILAIVAGSTVGLLLRWIFGGFDSRP